MDISRSLRKNSRDEITVLSLIAHCVQETYQNTMNNTIIVKSVQIRWKKIIVKTQNQLVNSELLLLSGTIHSSLDTKLKKMWFPSLLDLKFTFVS